MATKQKAPWWHKHIKSRARQICQWDPVKSEALRAAREGNGWRCAGCGWLWIFQMVAVDHKAPVVPVEGFKGWDAYFESLYGGLENRQVLCTFCHKAKSAKEMGQRAKARKKRSQ